MNRGLSMVTLIIRLVRPVWACGEIWAGIFQGGVSHSVNCDEKKKMIPHICGGGLQHRASPHANHPGAGGEERWVKKNTCLQQKSVYFSAAREAISE